MDFYYTDHGFYIFCLSKFQETKAINLVFDKSIGHIIFLCQDLSSKGLYLLNSIACQYVL